MNLKKYKNKIKKNQESNILIYKPLFDEKNNILLKRYSENKGGYRSKIIQFSSEKDRSNKMNKKKFRYFMHKGNLILRNSLIPQVHFYSFAYLFEGKEDVSKRLIDIVVALMALIILFPIFIIVAYKVQKNLGSPIFFYQERPGKNGKLFKMIKFRSMRNAIDKDGNPLPDKLRITSFGKKLRSTSLDEMPQLINVLKGDMSIVGPRPQMKEFLQHYTEEQMRRHEVKPGMTGLAQVSGRNNLSWEEKFELDVQYVERYNIWLDFKIMFKTAKVMLSQEGVNAPDQEVGAARFSKKSIHDTSLFTKEVK